MSKTRSFITAGAILGGTVIVTAAVAPLFLPNQNIKPLTSAQTLEEAITKMYHYQLGYDKLDKKEVSLLVAFLKTLTGEYNGKPVQGEVCPAS